MGYSVKYAILLVEILSSESCYCDETPGFSLGQNQEFSSLGEAICDIIFTLDLDHLTEYPD